MCVRGCTCVWMPIFLCHECVRARVCLHVSMGCTWAILPSHRLLAALFNGPSPTVHTHNKNRQVKEQKQKFSPKFCEMEKFPNLQPKKTRSCVNLHWHLWEGLLKLMPEASNSSCVLQSCVNRYVVLTNKFKSLALRYPFQMFMQDSVCNYKYKTLEDSIQIISCHYGYDHS